MSKAVIFDMDGVMIDSEVYWNHDESSLFKKWFHRWTEDDHKALIGLNIYDTYEHLTRHYGLKKTKEDYLKEVKAIADVIYASKANLVDGLIPLLQSLKAENSLVGLASSSLRVWIDSILSRFELRPYFKMTLSAEEIDGAGKPAPDIYIEAAKQLNTNPKDCVVIEDSRNGVLAGKAAGMTVIGFRNGFNETQDLSQADHIIHGLKEFDLQKFF